MNLGYYIYPLFEYLIEFHTFDEVVNIRLVYILYIICRFSVVKNSSTHKEMSYKQEIIYIDVV